MKNNILISGLGGSLFPTLHDKLKTKYNLFYIDSNENLKFIYPGLNFTPAPLVTSLEYTSFIKNIISKNNINYYLPLIDEEIILAKKLEGFYGVKVISPSLEFSQLCLDKCKLMDVLLKNKISFIPSYLGNEFNDQLEYPLFIKPNIGRGSRGIKKINSNEQLQAYYVLEQIPKENVLIQPNLEGIEYTVGVNIDSNNRILSICSKKVIEKKGITKMSIIEKNELINLKIIDIVNILKPFGPFNVQLIIKNNQIYIFEINPRFSTTTIMEYESDLDLLTQYITYSNQNNTPETVYVDNKLVLYRRWENIFYYE
jgi:carbamoyl-phosphate synthase large subunit